MDQFIIYILPFGITSYTGGMQRWDLGMSQVIRPKLFDGNSSIKKWLQKYEVCTQANGWNSGEMVVQLLSLLLGTAFDFAMRLPLEEQKSYNALTKRLLLEFRPRTTYSRAMHWSSVTAVDDLESH